MGPPPQRLPLPYLSPSLACSLPLSASLPRARLRTLAPAAVKRRHCRTPDAQPPFPGAPPRRPRLPRRRNGHGVAGVAAEDRFLPTDAELVAARFAVLRRPPPLPTLQAFSGCAFTSSPCPSSPRSPAPPPEPAGRRREPTGMRHAWPARGQLGLGLLGHRGADMDPGSTGQRPWAKQTTVQKGPCGLFKI
jgi:hypothetical protein